MTIQEICLKLNEKNISKLAEAFELFKAKRMTWKELEKQVKEI